MSAQQSTTTTPQHVKQKQHHAALRRMQSSPAAFRDALMIDADGGAVRLGEVLDPWQRADFEAIDPAWHYVAHRTGPAPTHNRAWLERPRGHSKTNDLAVMIAWVLFASPRRLVGLAAAADRDQAKLLRDAVSKLVATNPWLSKFLDVQAFRIINPHTESTLEIISSDAPSSYGATPDFIICDELTHWARRDLFDSLLSSAAKRSHCTLLIICNAGFQDSWQWELREAIRDSAGWFFHALDGPQASWISEKHLAEQRRLLPTIAFDRLWLNRWGTGSGDAIDPADLAAAIHTHHHAGTIHPALGWTYAAGIDIGLRRDASSVCVVGRHVGHSVAIPKTIPGDTARGAMAAMIDLGFIEPRASNLETEYRVTEPTGRYAVPHVAMWRPAGGTVSISAIEDEIRKLHAIYNFAAVGADPWQAALLIERLRAVGVPIDPVDFVSTNLKSMASVVLESFRERTIELADHPQLRADLQSLRVEEKSYGIRLVAPRDGHGHGDAGTAMSIGLLVASRCTAAGATRRIDGPLLCWP
jgi:phage terminase large subunit-like protein